MKAKREGFLDDKTMENSEPINMLMFLRMRQDKKRLRKRTDCERKVKRTRTLRQLRISYQEDRTLIVINARHVIKHPLALASLFILPNMIQSVSTPRSIPPKKTKQSHTHSHRHLYSSRRGSTPSIVGASHRQPLMLRAATRPPVSATPCVLHRILQQVHHALVQRVLGGGDLQLEQAGHLQHVLLDVVAQQLGKLRVLGQNRE